MFIFLSNVKYFDKVFQTEGCEYWIHVFEELKMKHFSWGGGWGGGVDGLEGDCHIL